ncbi:hypothetical protein, partial [Streptomyces morookaense]|uniref:hypothetical protein n=1 Tax=Streptomyces morookaense TaxID=1970 RepID=UPI001C3F9E01
MGHLRAGGLLLRLRLRPRLRAVRLLLRFLRAVRLLLRLRRVGCRPLPRRLPLRLRAVRRPLPRRLLPPRP